MEIIKGREVCIGNFVSVFGETQIVNGLKIDENGNIAIQIGDIVEDVGVPIPIRGIPINSAWLKFLGLGDGEQTILPNWIKYVHQLQNYYLFALNTPITKAEGVLNSTETKQILYQEL